MRIACPSCDVAPDVSATPGSPCRACGTALVARDRKRRTSALDGIVAPPPSSPAIAAPPLELPETLDLAVVDLGERTGTAPAAPRPAPAVPAAEPEPLAELAPPPEDVPLELDAEWQREKAARQVAPSEGAQRVAREAALRSAPTSGGVPWVLVLVIAAGLGAGGYYLMTRKPSAPAASEPVAPAEAPVADPSAPSTTVPRRGVTIRIVGAPGTPVTIDGARAGKTPITLERRGGAKAITIETARGTIRVIPDHDQTVDITAPP